MASRSCTAIFSYGLRASADGATIVATTGCGRAGIRLNNEVDARWSDSETHAAYTFNVVEPPPA